MARISDRGRRDDRNAIAWFELRDAIVEIDDFASRIGAEHRAIESSSDTCQSGQRNRACG